MESTWPILTVWAKTSGSKSAPTPSQSDEVWKSRCTCRYRRSLIRLPLQEKLDDRHLDRRPLHRQLKGQRAPRDTPHSRVLGLLVRVYDLHLYLRGVVEQLRVLDPVSESFQVDVLEGPSEDVQVEPVAVPG